MHIDMLINFISHKLLVLVMVTLLGKPNANKPLYADICNYRENKK